MAKKIVTPASSVSSFAAPAAQTPTDSAAAKTPAKPVFGADVLAATRQQASAHLQSAAGQAEALISAWVTAKNANAIDEIAESPTSPTPARKAAKRALSVLKSRGVSADRGATVVSPIKPDHRIEARMLYPDGQGNQIFWIAKVSDLGSTEVVEVRVHDRAGLLDLQRGNPSYGALRQIWNSWGSRAGRVPPEVPIAYARRRIAEAKAMAESQQRILPLAIAGAASLLTADSSDAGHPIDREGLALPTDETAVKNRLGQSMALHGEPEFASWLPEDGARQALIGSINEKITALAEDGRTQEALAAIVDPALDEATDAYFDDSRKKLYIARLRDVAWSFVQAERPDRAIDSLLLAQAIEKAGIVSDRPSEVPALRGLFVKAIVMAQSQGQQDAQNAQNV